MIEIAHQSRTGKAAGHPFRRTTHVDVDRIGAGRLGEPGCLAHPMRLTAGDLDNMRRNPRPFGAQSRLFGPANVSIGSDHLRNDEGRSEALRQPTHA